MNIQARAASSFDLYDFVLRSPPNITILESFKVFLILACLFCVSAFEWFWKLFVFIKVFLAQRGYEFLFCVLLRGGGGELKLSLNVSVEFHVNFKNHLFWGYNIGLERKYEPQCHISS